ncbi:uncharacterized protein LOC117557565 isoform X2 [Gymnodraco acuticeps]|uniref:Uncharacterized protein LOC117557565 isoform X2 n=1 Tax=Gymnodraco acuticeps TaxID=8218 RepID=A0A6P8VGC8_GYMAC|nr:uncharacterized protein LOC117557565 isoform X2 [Gymnodraco acuticeps]
MSRRVCCLYCVEKSTMFAVPKAEPRRSQWLTFLFNTVPADLPAGTVVCARHFTDLSFGLAVKLILEDDAVPTLFGPAGDLGTQPSTSQQEHNTHRSSTVGCQTDRPQTVSVGTQRVETRSVGTQTVECKVSAISVATQLARGTLKSAHVRSKEIPLSSTPIKGPGLGPSKRPRLELEQEQGETSIEFEETLDSSYHPDDTVEESDVSQWESQPIIGSTPVGNLQLSAATYFTGASFFQLKKICRAMQLEIFQYETFRRHARHYLEPAIIHKWKTDQLKIFQQLHHQGGKVTVAGDMRADSPGHSAKFGSYTLMHLGSNTIVDFQLVQCTWVS